MLLSLFPVAFLRNDKILVLYLGCLDMGRFTLVMVMDIFRNSLCSFYLQVTQLDLHRQFHSFGAGVIEEVRVQRDKGFGFVRYSTHAEAALAIQMGNTTQSSYLFGKQMKVRFFASFAHFHSP